MACGSLGQGTPRGAICRETAAGCTPTRRQPARSSRPERAGESARPCSAPAPPPSAKPHAVVGSSGQAGDQRLYPVRQDAVKL